MQSKKTDILIVGGGLGGVAAALAAARLGHKVILTEETDWIGGQLTAQAVPPDEHPWIEFTGCTASYRWLRETIRAYYRKYYPLLDHARRDSFLNPGKGLVSRLCHEPRVALAAMEALLAPYRASLRVEILTHHVAQAVETRGDRVGVVQLLNRENGQLLEVTADYVLDATELGDLLELAMVEHVIGAESQSQTGELHAVVGAPQPLDQQAISWCFALDYIEGADFTISKPVQYDFWKGYQADFWPGPQLGWRDVDPMTLEPRQKPLFGRLREGKTWSDFSFWLYRRIFYKDLYPAGLYPSDITLVNWPQIDYWLGPLLGVTPQEAAKNLEACRQLSLSFLYWMQTEAPREDGGQGYRGLRIRPDIVGTADGLAKMVYIRESRRIQAEFTVLEQHIGVEARGAQRGSEIFPDSVGVGSYRIDLHPSTGGRTYIDISSYPFQIPLGALIPVRVENLLPACKNLGVTHITNGCYRLHPVEWNIGEAAGALAAFCLDRRVLPRQVRNTPGLMEDFQKLLADQLGFVLAWQEYARITPR